MNTQAMLDTKLRTYIEAFNLDDDEQYREHIPNAQCYDFLQKNIPLLDCPDAQMELTYYYRWWAYRKHIRLSPEGYVITEFFPDVPWAGAHNTIVMAAGCHMLEGRWLRDRSILDDYTRFWFSHPVESTYYASWLVEGMYRRALLTGDATLLRDNLPTLVAMYERWEQGFLHRDKHSIGLRGNGLFRTIDDREGTEISISGHGFRPLLNACLYAHARVIATLAAGTPLGQTYAAKADRLRETYLNRLWNPALQFFTPLGDDDRTQADVRELYGYAPWFFDMLAHEGQYDVAWQQVIDTNGFLAPYGLTFAEQRHPGFALNYTGHHCQWNGPSWPISTSFALDAMGNMLQTAPGGHVSAVDFQNLLTTYALSHRRITDEGKIIPWLDENLHPYTGDWLSRTIINTQPGEVFKGRERGREYNHSTFCDVVISRLFGIVPQADGTLSVLPLVSGSRYPYFLLKDVPVGGHLITLQWDATGTRYGQGAGFRIFRDSQVIHESQAITQVRAL